MFTLATLDRPEMIAVEPADMQAAKAVYNAVNNPTGDLSEIINREIEIANIHMQADERISDTNDQPYTRYTTTIILTDGTSYRTTYTNVAKSCIRLLNTFGAPDTWPEPLRVIPRIKSFGGGFHDTITIDVI